MNQIDTVHLLAAREASEARFARGIAACLSESSERAGPDVAERLRFAREKAIASVRTRRSADGAQTVGRNSSGAAVLGFGHSSWWLRLASVLPLVALVGGLVLIQDSQTRSQISIAAEVDEALLGDDLPINAYRDPGFTEFLQAPSSE